MRKLSLSVLAASIALIPSGASAQTVVAPGYGPQMAPMMMPPPNLPRRLERGWVVNPYWMGPQFTISNWQSYGFADPGAGRHWIRYYDDAYLVDQSGRVIDMRGGLDWDQYGEQWDVVNGIPAYRGSRAWQPGAQDYATAAAGYQSGSYQAGGYSYQAQGATPVPAPGAPVYGVAPPVQMQYYGAYGWYGPPVIIYQIGGAAAAAGAAYSEEIIEEYVEQAQAQRRRPVRRARPVRRPPPGERG